MLQEEMECLSSQVRERAEASPVKQVSPQAEPLGGQGCAHLRPGDWDEFVDLVTLEEELLSYRQQHGESMEKYVRRFQLAAARLIACYRTLRGPHARVGALEKVLVEGVQSDALNAWLATELRDVLKRDGVRLHDVCSLDDMGKYLPPLLDMARSVRDSGKSTQRRANPAGENPLQGKENKGKKFDGKGGKRNQRRNPGLSQSRQNTSSAFRPWMRMILLLLRCISLQHYCSSAATQRANTDLLHSTSYHDVRSLHSL